MRKYHPDYLGHNEYITDITGRPYQHFHYSAFGESLIEKNTNYGQFSSPYRFNGKELDPETGNYYYGARYYNPVWGIWLGVDPLAHKYPSMSPFVFTGNNPINAIDPDGRKVKWNLSGILVAASMLFTKTGRENLQAMRNDQYVTYQFRLTRSVGMSYNPKNKSWGLVEGDQYQAEGDDCLMVMTIYMGTFKTKHEAENRYKMDWDALPKERQLSVINYFVKNREKNVEFIEDNGDNTGRVHKMKDGEFLSENYLNGKDRGYIDASPINESKSNYRGRVGTHESTHGLIESGAWQDSNSGNKEEYPNQRELQFQQDKQQL